MKTQWKKTIPTVLLYAVLIVIVVVALFPLFYIVMASFRTDEEIFRYALPFSINTLIPVNWTLENYKIIFTQFQFWRPILNTCLVVLIVVPLNLFVASVAAYTFAFFDFKGKNALFPIFIVSLNANNVKGRIEVKACFRFQALFNGMQRNQISFPAFGST